MMPINPIIVVEIFYEYDINFTEPFPSSFGIEYILLAMDYASKWIEVILSMTNDAKRAVSFLKKNIFARFDKAELSFLISIPTLLINFLMLY